MLALADRLAQYKVEGHTTRPMASESWCVLWV